MKCIKFVQIIGFLSYVNIILKMINFIWVKLEEKKSERKEIKWKCEWSKVK